MLPLIVSNDDILAILVTPLPNPPFESLASL